MDLGFQLHEARDGSFTSKSNDDIAGEPTFVDECSRDRARSAPKGVSHHRVATLGGNNDTHPNAFGWATINNEVCRNLLLSAADYLTKIAGLNDAVVAGQQRGILDGNFAAALATTGGKDRASGTSAHAQTETVNLRATAVVGLVRTLRHLFSSASGRHSQVE